MKRGLLTFGLACCVGLLLACEAPHESVPRRPAPANPPAGAWRELQAAVVTRNEVWAASRIALAAVDGPAEHAVNGRLELARSLMTKLAPLLEHTLALTEPADVWLRFGRHGRYLGGRATLVVGVSPLEPFRHGESLEAWTRRVREEPAADPLGVGEPAVRLETYWVAEQDEWRLRHLLIRGPQPDSTWVLPTQGAAELLPADVATDANAANAVAGTSADSEAEQP